MSGRYVPVGRLARERKMIRVIDIVTEGKSEKKYFEDLKKGCILNLTFQVLLTAMSISGWTKFELNSQQLSNLGCIPRRCGYRINIHSPRVSDPSRLVEESIDHMERLELHVKDGDEAWCVFDVDENDHEMIGSVMKQAERHGISTILSNPCYEQWYLLHYEYSDTLLTRHEVVEKVADRIPGYRKTSRVFLHLEEKRDAAIRNARRLKKEAGTEPFKRPFTDIFILVDRLMRLRKEE